jgi:hypothetical protein
MRNDLHESTLITLEQVITQQLLFNIPIYQRLYVWGSDQIKLLLEDLVAAYEAEKTVFYLGGALVIEQGASSAGLPLLDLIDGQQRFTTLWLLSIALQRLAAGRGEQDTNHLADLGVVRSGATTEPRIRFAIRPEVSRFFDALLSGSEVPDVPAAGSLSRAVVEIESYFQDHPALSLTRLSEFIRHRVQIVLTRVPAQTDLNKLFEVINNRGVQLQHHEILKARLLGSLEDSGQREVYGQLWDACSHMNDYVEKNLRTAAGIRLVPLHDNQLAAADREALADPASVRQALAHLYKASDAHVLTLAAILDGAVSTVANRQGKEADETYEADVVRSIITFSTLLQHVLRIFLKRHGRNDIEKVLDKDLLQIFQAHWLNAAAAPEDREAEVMEFIDLLWRCRYLFDKHVIKWVEGEDDDEVHAIRRLRVNSSGNSQSLIRESRDADHPFAILQSMLYHSQQLTTHYWLTPLINYLVEYGPANAHLYLKYLDNYLLSSTSEEPLIKRTRRFLERPWYDGFDLRDIGAKLRGNEGTGFSHYWFYKLEYILWDKYRQQMGDAWQAFRMTAKNSVEHVSPQTPEKFDSNKVSNEVLDTFGNLALVSRSINSEYGNKPYVEKRARFRERNARRADSLKLALIYEHEQWNDELANRHRAQMIADYEAYLANVDASAASVQRTLSNFMA